MKKKLNSEELSDLANESILKSLRGRMIGDMSPESIVYWLQGFIELENPKTLTVRQTQIVKDHLAFVFDKKTPDRIKLDTPTEPFKPVRRSGLPHFCGDSTSRKIC